MKRNSEKTAARAELGRMTLSEYYQDSNQQDKIKRVNLLYRLDQSIAHKGGFSIVTYSIKTQSRVLTTLNKRDIMVIRDSGDYVPIRTVCDLIAVAYPEPKYKISTTMEIRDNVITVQEFKVDIVKRGRW